MRRLLDGLYRASGGIAAAFLVAIAAVVLLQVGLNLVDALAAWLTGSPIGLVIPSYAAFAGYFLAATSFLALAYALRNGAHIRVSLVLHRMRSGPRRVLEVWCASAGAVTAGYFSWYAVALVRESLAYGDLSPGMVPVPLWIPQAAMAAGLVVLTIALADTAIELMMGRDEGSTGSDLNGSAR